MTIPVHIRDFRKKNNKTHELDSGSIYPESWEDNKVKWEVRKISEGRWGIFLMQEFCTTEEPVCYAVSVNRETAERSVKRMNDTPDAERR